MVLCVTSHHLPTPNGTDHDDEKGQISGQEKAGYIGVGTLNIFHLLEACPLSIIVIAN